MNNRQGIIIAAVLVVAAGIAFVAMRGNAPKSGTEGAIGAANRYSAEQITSKDVQLTDADVQSFLQSDTFRALQTNPDFRKFAAANRSEMASAGTAPRTIELVSAPGFGKFIQDARFLPSKRFVTLIKNKEFVEMVSSAEAGQLATLDAFATLERTQVQALNKAALDKNAVALLKEPKFLEFMAEVEKSQITQKAELDRMTTDAAHAVHEMAAYQTLQKSEYFNALMLDKNFQTMAQNHAFVELLTSERYATIARSSGTELAEVAANGAMVDLASNRQYLDLIQSPATVELMTSEEVGRLALDRNFLNLVETQNVGQLLERSEVRSLLTATAE